MKILLNRKGFGIAARFAVLTLTLGFGQAAYAVSTAADATIRSTVTLSYDQSVTDLTDFVDVEVNLVEATPTLSFTPSVGITSDQTDTLAFLISANSNGPDTYNVILNPAPLCETDAATCAAFNGANGGEISFTGAALASGTGTAVATVVLNATSYVSGAFTLCSGTSGSGCVLTVPNDNDADSDINDLVAGNTVVFGSNNAVCTIGVVVDNGGAASFGATSTMELFDCSVIPVAAAGQVIGQQKTFDLVFDPDFVGSVILPSGDNEENIDIAVEVRDDAAAAAAATQTPNISVTQNLTLTIEKYVKNITTPSGTCAIAAPETGATNPPADAANFCTVGTTADPGDVLEYLIVVANGAGSTTSNLEVSEPIADFVNYTASSIKTIKATDAAWVNQTDAASDDIAEFVDPNITVYVGNGASAIGGGNLISNEIFYIVYRVTVQ
jgi:hypothetical protein